MSRDVKYIGMDVHKEAVVIAVLSSNGKLVMESIVETKASSILQFIHGLRGELHVTWEEGAWAAWLYDAATPGDARAGVRSAAHIRRPGSRPRRQRQLGCLRPRRDTRRNYGVHAGSKTVLPPI